MDVCLEWLGQWFAYCFPCIPHAHRHHHHRHYHSRSNSSSNTDTHMRPMSANWRRETSLSDMITVYQVHKNNPNIPITAPCWCLTAPIERNCSVCFHQTDSQLPCCGKAMCGKCVHIWARRERLAGDGDGDGDSRSLHNDCPFCTEQWPPIIMDI